MRTLYLIFSHDHQTQLVRLVAALRHLSSSSVIAIHHDPGKEGLDISLFAGIPGVHVIPDAIPGEWGDFSLVEQYIHAMRWCRANIEFDWMVTLTGLSYPIMQLERFEGTLESSEFDAYIQHFNAFDPAHWPKGTGVTRYLFAYYKLPRNPYYYKVPAGIRSWLGRRRASFNKSQPFLRIVPMPRGSQTRVGIRRLRFPFPENFVISGGRQMLNLNRHALDRVLSYIDTHQDYVSYAKRTLIPDESFFTSIVANEADLRVSNDVLRYIKWPSGKSHSASVTVIMCSEVETAMQSGKPFALKFDSRADAEALNKLDRLLGIESSAVRETT